MIGIVSHEADVHAAYVRAALDRLGADHVVIDTGAVPGHLALTSRQDAGGWRGSWGDVVPDLADLRAMWWRRPQPFGLADRVTNAQDRQFAAGECASMVSGLWSCLDATWVNDPDRDAAASRKMWQLKVASRLGLRVPRTVMTSSPDAARAFVQSEPGRVVFKPFGGTPDTWRETRIVREEELELLDRVALAPVIFQEAIEGGTDVRVTIVGDQLFPAVITARSEEYEFDFRIDAAAPVEEHVLPTEVESRLREMMRQLGLFYGAVDLRIDPAGEHVFLEVNPAGQWLFVEVATGQPITAALARLLRDLDDQSCQAATWARRSRPSLARTVET